MPDSPVLVEADFATRIAEVAGPAVTVTDLSPMTGGHSGLTHLAQLRGLPGHDAVVIKSTPPGRRPQGRHDVLRQARILDALAPIAGVPVPEVCFRDGADPPFFATALVPGDAVDPVIDEDRTSLDSGVVAGRWEAAIDVLAALHEIPLDSLGLGDEPIRTPDEELGIWEATLVAAGLGEDPRVERLLAAMRASAPPSGDPVLVHGDFRLGNLLFEQAEPRALIDWEIWSATDAGVDLAWFVQFTDAENFPGVGHSVPGTPGAEEVLDRYEARRGHALGDHHWLLALGCLKLAAIQAHNRRRHLDGRYHDPYTEKLGPSIDRLLERARNYVDA